jgi:predicted branched-subunit amino acid permease
LAALNWVVWQVASVVGIFAAGWASSEWGLELAAVLALVAVVLPMLNNPPAVFGVAVAGVISVVAAGLPLRLGLPLAVVCGVCVAFAMESTPLGRRVKAAGG